MNFALQNTLELLLIIGLGLLLQKKASKQDLKGVKVIILSIALPAVIFVALLKIKLDTSLLIFPVMALVFNLLLLAASKYIFTASISKEDSAKKHTLMMLLPSLAPGLSCFPFLAIYLGDDSVALAALADVGNKIFVLIILYMVAMNWYHLRSMSDQAPSMSNKLKSLGIALLKEPINMVIIIGLLLLTFGFNIDSLPDFIKNTVLSVKTIMTPLILLFIGMAVRIKGGEFGLIISMLMRRAGITFMLSAIFVLLVPSLATPLILLIVAFPQSACSFWPFAHMSAISAMEDDDKQTKPTFDINFAVNILALSLPFSTVIIIGIFSFSDFFVNPLILILLGVGLTAVSYVPSLITKFKNSNYTETTGKYNTYSTEEN